MFGFRMPPQPPSGEVVIADTRSSVDSCVACIESAMGVDDSTDFIDYSDSAAAALGKLVALPRELSAVLPGAAAKSAAFAAVGDDA